MSSPDFLEQIIRHRVPRASALPDSNFSGVRADGSSSEESPAELAIEVDCSLEVEVLLEGCRKND